MSTPEVLLIDQLRVIHCTAARKRAAASSSTRRVQDDPQLTLTSGQLAGAGLDVADPEPLPADSPLWGMPNVLITPHVAILGTPYRQKWEALLLENCRRFAAGQTLINVVDKEKWY